MACITTCTHCPLLRPQHQDEPVCALGYDLDFRHGAWRSTNCQLDHVSYTDAQGKRCTYWPDTDTTD